jgi:hypothetical protein
LLQFTMLPFFGQQSSVDDVLQVLSQRVQSLVEQPSHVCCPQQTNEPMMPLASH